MIICFICYYIDLIKKVQFEKYVCNWGQVIFCCGVNLIGYFILYEGLIILVYGVYFIENLVVYEVYCVWFFVDLMGQENYVFVMCEKFILREDWIFLKLVLMLYGKLIGFEGEY